MWIGTISFVFDITTVLNHYCFHVLNDLICYSSVLQQQHLLDVLSVDECKLIKSWNVVHLYLFELLHSLPKLEAVTN